MDNFTCCACKKTFPTLKSLHLHVARKEKIGLDSYYKLYFPRMDYFTNEQIDFKNHEQYFSSYFNSKDNMANWFAANWGTEKAKNLAQAILTHRIKTKELKVAPSQVELRTISSPSVTSLQKMFDYNTFCKSMGLKTRYRYGIISDLKPHQDIKILVDTREQTPFKFAQSEVRKLDVGDYTAAEPNYADVYIERKSVQDFYGTFYNPTNYERFEKEMARAKSYGFYVIVVVEGTLNSCLAYKTIFVKDRNFVVHTFHNVRNLMQKFDNLQFVFSYNNFTAQQLTTKILNQGASARDLDWQYLVETKQL